MYPPGLGMHSGLGGVVGGHERERKNPMPELTVMMVAAPRVSRCGVKASMTRMVPSRLVTTVVSATVACAGVAQVFGEQDAGHRHHGVKAGVPSAINTVRLVMSIMTSPIALGYDRIVGRSRVRRRHADQVILSSQERRVRRPVRISLTRSSGCSKAAKCPPLPASP